MLYEGYRTGNSRGAIGVQERYRMGTEGVQRGERRGTIRLQVGVQDGYRGGTGEIKYICVAYGEI